MAKNSNNRLDGFLNEARLLIDGARTDPTVAAQLTGFGYDAPALAAGKALHEEVLGLHAAQKKEYGEQFEATQALNAAWAEAEAPYLKSVKLARVVFRDDPKAWAALQLAGERGRSLSAWLDQSTVFYRNLLGDPALLAALAKVGLTRDKAVAEQALVQTVADRQVAQRRETGEAQEATEQRDTKIAALDRWVQDFRAVAKVALGDRPQLLEKLGITA